MGVANRPMLAGKFSACPGDTFPGSFGGRLSGSYPNTAAKMAAAVGYGTWTGGWLCDESGGNLLPAFGAPSLTAASSPTNGIPGALDADKCVAFVAANSNFGGGNTHDLPTTSDDLVIAMVINTSGGLVSDILSKYAGSGAGYLLYNNGVGEWLLSLRDGTNLQNALVNVGPIANTWAVMLAAVDRGTQRACIGFRSLCGTGTAIGSQSDITAVLAMTNASSFTVGRANGTGVAPAATRIAFVAVGEGVGAGTGIPANMATALANFSRAIGGQ